MLSDKKEFQHEKIFEFYSCAGYDLHLRSAVGDERICTSIVRRPRRLCAYVFHVV